MTSGSEPTIKDIAEKLNLSKSTVSRAISGRGRIGADTRRRVMEAIADQGYKPNAIARSLAVSRAGNLGVILTPEFTSSSFFPECLCGIMEMASFEDYDVLVVPHGDAEAQTRVIRQRKVDGIISMLPASSCEADIPHVLIGTGRGDEGVYVNTDCETAARELTEHLLLRSPGRVAFIGGVTEAHVASLNGFIRAHEERGLAVREGYSMTGVRSEVQARHHLSRLFRRDAPKAILASDDVFCRWSLGFLKEQGISVPCGVRLASLRDSAYLSEHAPPVTAVDTAPRLLGETACRLLIEWIQGEKPALLTLTPYRIILKDST